MFSARNDFHSNRRPYTTREEAGAQLLIFISIVIAYFWSLAMHCIHVLQFTMNVAAVLQQSRAQSAKRMNSWTLKGSIMHGEVRNNDCFITRSLIADPLSSDDYHSDRLSWKTREAGANCLPLFPWLSTTERSADRMKVAETIKEAAEKLAGGYFVS